METKAYSLQAPEQIAKDYGGNKQKIAEAMQTGILDPTAGTLAGMFIDRMRSAAQAEQAPQQTVAQKTFAPPAPPPAAAPMGGMPPQGGLPPAPPAPPMGPPAGLGATPEAAQMPQMDMPPEEPPMDMAEGGLTTLPLPDGMFDEPNNGGYANGGIVAFANSGVVRDPNKLKTARDEDEDADILTSKGTEEDIAAEAALEAKGGIGVTGAKTVPPVVKMLGGTDYTTPAKLYGHSADPLTNLDRNDEMAPRATKRAEQLQAYLDAALDPEAKKAKAKDDFMTAMGVLGAKMASTPGSLFQSFNAGAAEAIPQLSSAAGTRDAAEREVLNTLTAEERTGNKELQERAASAIEMSKDYGTFAEAMKDRDFKARLQREGFDVDIVIAKINAGASIRNALTAAGASMFGSNRAYDSDRLRHRTEVTTAVREAIGKGGPNHLGYREAVAAGTGPQFIRDLRSAFGDDSATILFDSKGNQI